MHDLSAWAAAMRQNTAAALAMGTLSMAFAAHVYTGELSRQQGWVKSTLGQPSDLKRQLLADAETPLSAHKLVVNMCLQAVARARMVHSKHNTFGSAWPVSISEHVERATGQAANLCSFIQDIHCLWMNAKNGR